MTSNHSNKFAILRKFSVFFSILLVANTLAGQKGVTKDVNSTNSNGTEWWSPILQRHDITPAAFNNFEKVFETGSTNSITNRIVTLDSAFILLKPERDEYVIIRSLKAYHDLDSNIIKAENGSMESYNLKSKEVSPKQSVSFEYLRYQVDTKKVMARQITGKATLK